MRLAARKVQLIAGIQRIEMLPRNSQTGMEMRWLHPIWLSATRMLSGLRGRRSAARVLNLTNGHVVDCQAGTLRGRASTRCSSYAGLRVRYEPSLASPVAGLFGVASDARSRASCCVRFVWFSAQQRCHIKRHLLLRCVSHGSSLGVPAVRALRGVLAQIAPCLGFGIYHHDLIVTSGLTRPCPNPKDFPAPSRFCNIET